MFAYPVFDQNATGGGVRQHRALSVENRRNQNRGTAITGLYFYDSQVVTIAKSQAFRPRELEITDINKTYLERGELEVMVMGREWPGSIPERTSL